MATNTDRQWFIVQTYAGYENKVKANLDQRIATMGMEDKIFNVLVPVEEKMVVKDGKSKKVTKKLFPSYVLVEMVMEDQPWYVVRHTPGVTGFVGSGNHPIPLSQKEIDDVMDKIGGSAGKKGDRPTFDMNFAKGDVIKVKCGPFEGAVGPIVDILPDKGKVKFSVSVFGRDTLVEIDYTELEKL
ncbi:transcription termination/antitermination protein NusG [Dethiosulfovibrio salsuginis]|uniref:Transcription termination/antitermination protein NusG n=1 Tax=Dethiosulfovibrio salsuginis TaxID=561720 RepID=A0A1X7JZK4_9BACT|nr:transcription termination/antitermination protein NusG [Dethiosulfovibrio salsuginis]SMG33788.1 transcription antitermination protein nusG [Dethiosulfovibrio salsuginis]